MTARDVGGLIEAYRGFLVSTGIPERLSKYTEPTHIRPQQGPPTPPLTGEEFIRLASAYRNAGPHDSPSIYAYVDGRRCPAISNLLEGPLSWESDPRAQCHSVLASVGGATIRLTDAQKMAKRVYCFSEALFREVRGAGEVHAFYSTPASGRAIPSHRDSGIQVIYQISGEKDWYFDRSDDTNTRLVAGDFLVIPLARMHRAETTGTYSLHLTIMVNPIPELAVTEVIVRGFSATGW